MTKVFISQPMAGKTDQEILAEREEAIRELKEKYGEIEIIDSFFQGTEEKPLVCLAHSLELLAEADVAWFCKGWSRARGCRIEHSCAERYGIETAGALRELYYEDNLTTAIIKAIEGHTGETEPPRSAYEAYAMLKQRIEDAEKISARTKDLMKELWSGVKENSDEVVAAHARELSTVGRQSAVAFAEVAAVAQLTEEAGV